MRSSEDDLLGGDDRIPLDDEADRRADQQLLGGQRRCCQRDERIVGPAVLGRQLAAGGVWGLASRRDVCVLGKQQTFKASILRHLRKLGRVLDVCRGEDRDAKFHRPFTLQR